MMKKLTLVIFASVITLTAFSQTSQKGVNYLNAGIGVGSYYKGLPFGISYEHGFTDEITAGASLDYSSYNYGNIFGGGSAKLNIIYFALRGS